MALTLHLDSKTANIQLDPFCNDLACLFRLQNSTYLEFQGYLLCRMLATHVIKSTQPFQWRVPWYNILAPANSSLFDIRPFQVLWNNSVLPKHPMKPYNHDSQVIWGRPCSVNLSLCKKYKTLGDVFNIQGQMIWELDIFIIMRNYTCILTVNQKWTIASTCQIINALFFIVHRKRI